MAYPYLDAAGVRERISVGGPPLDTGSFPDPWVVDAVAEVESRVEAECGVAFTPREQVETVGVTGCTDRLVLKWPKVRDVTAVTIDGDAVTADTWTLIDPEAGIVKLPRTVTRDQVVTVSYEHGFDEPPPILLRATAIYVERLAAAQRSRSNRDVKVGLTEGGSTVYVRPQPGTWQLTGWDDFDAIVASLPHYRIPGIA